MLCKFKSKLKAKLTANLIHNTSAVFFCLFNIININQTFAWHQTGHMLVASIAYQNVDKKIIQRLDQLANLGTKEYPMTTNFITTSVWPDDIKSHGINFFNNWHYEDNYFSTDGSPLPKLYNDGKALMMLKKLRELLKSNSTTESEKAFALKFYTHLVGDMHQPLHNTSNVTKNNPNGDRGGNSFKLKGKYNNLHALWDGGFGLLQEHNRPLDNGAANWLNDYANNLISDFPRNSFADDVISASYKDRQDENVNIVKNTVYLNIVPNEKPSNNYINTNKDIMRRQIAVAGYRLANDLNCIFGSNQCIS